MFIKNSACISPQNTFPSAFPEATLREYSGNKYFAAEPSYEGLIPAGALRRMGRAVRMGVATGTTLLRQTPGTDGIIIGTASGGLEDCIKFLNQIVDYNEGTLTPTNFVQSTPNALAGQLALIHRNTGYNITHSHGGLSFENALIDAMLLMEQDEVCRLLVGSIEEISEYNHNIDRLAGIFKEETASSSRLLSSTTPGTVNGEGSAMFVLEKEPSQQNPVRVAAVTHTSCTSPDELPGLLEETLTQSGTDAGRIDGLILGYNGDYASSGWYDIVRDRFVADIPVFSFKNACGEYPTASSFAVWLGQQILTGQPYPASLLLSGKMTGTMQNILIYNHYLGEQHSFILLERGGA